jgi:hypothetical protein
MNLRGVLGAGVLLSVLATPLWAANMQFKGYNFEAQVIKESGRQYREFTENNLPLLKVKPNEEYSIVVRNPLPVRVGVAVSIDGLNTIDGKRTSARTAQKWIIEPNSSITVAGWQTSKRTLRKFLFTSESASFAQWRENRDGKAFTRNLGVIGVAWFWNSNELEQALHPPQPQPFVEDRERMRSADMAGAAKSAPASRRAEERAGTGMGHQEQNYVTQVEFRADTGMYSNKDVMKIFYEFAKVSDEPQPFVEDDEDEGRFSPDMYKR